MYTENKINCGPHWLRCEDKRIGTCCDPGAETKSVAPAKFTGFGSMGMAPNEKPSKDIPRAKSSGDSGVPSLSISTVLAPPIAAPHTAKNSGGEMLLLGNANFPGTIGNAAVWRTTHPLSVYTMWNGGGGV